MLQQETRTQTQTLADHLVRLTSEVAQLRQEARMRTYTPPQAFAP
ncbi:hypothetical protein [Pararoseomonas baculiformis]|nr:hypothetical protein [Pararoseomonas baculiformis]